MADVMPNYRISQAKLRAEIANLEARQLAHQVSLLELVDRRDAILRNRDAELEAIETKRESLASLEAAHGAVTTAEVADAETTQLDPDLGADN